jgi:hypothetical protein
MPGAYSRNDNPIQFVYALTNSVAVLFTETDILKADSTIICLNAHLSKVNRKPFGDGGVGLFLGC